MHISVVGAAGMVGSQITAEALSRGHQVDAYTRSGRTTDLTATQPLALTDTDAVAQVVNASDATVITVGGRDDYEAVVAAHERLIAARPTGRVLVVGGAGALPVGEGRLLDSPDFPAEYLPEAKAFARVFVASVADHLQGGQKQRLRERFVHPPCLPRLGVDALPSLRSLFVSSFLKLNLPLQCQRQHLRRP